MDTSDAEATLQLARRALKRFTTEGIEGWTKPILKKAGWVTYGRVGAMWHLTSAGKAEAERLGYL